jgi:predicted amidohydrolase YtcJ
MQQVPKSVNSRFGLPSGPATIWEEMKMEFSRRKFLGAVSAASLSGVSRLQAQAGSADLVLFNGKIVTVDDAFSIHQAIVIKDGRIAAVGGNELRNQYNALRTIDLRGRMVMPGFHDTHIHLGGHSRRYIDLNDTTSLAQLKEQVQDKAKELGPGEWITGAGWDEYHFTEQRKPLREDLDAAAPNNPVVLTRAGGHSSVGNSKALELADINKATPDPPRGLIEKDASGAPNGVIRERSDLYTRLVPKDKPADVRESLLKNVSDQLKLGITSVIEAGSSVDPNVVGSYAEWEILYQKHGAQLPRASIQVGYPSPAGEAKAGAQKLKEFGKKTGDGNDRLRVGSIGEMAADGGFTGPTAWSLVDYKGQPGFRGRAFFNPEEIHANIEEGHKLGWQFGIHAIGDAAIAMTVDALDTVLQKYPRNDHRHYLCHFTVLPPERTMQIMAKDKILIAQQPNFTYNLEGRYVETLEGNRLNTNNALTTPIRKYGIFMAFGSDNLPIGPMVGLYAAVTRKGESGKVYGAGEAVSMKDAITMYTRSGAFLTREEKIKGTLEVGKLADMIVLPQDILSVSPEKVLNMKVDMTIVGGKVLYERT